MYLFDIFINNGRICMGFKADWVEKVHNLAYLIRFYKKMSDEKVIDEKMLKILVDLQ